MGNDAQTKVCQVKMHDGKPCGREIFKKPSFFADTCVFHLGGNSHFKKEEFDEQLKSYIAQVETDDRLEAYDFRRFVFPDGTKFIRKMFSKQAIFYEALFEGSVRFISTTFKEEANFGYTRFKYSHFQGVDFHAPASFAGAEFADNAIFSSSEAPELEKTRFRKEVFFGSNFLQGAFFSGVSFEGDACFRGAKFKQGGKFAPAEWPDGKSGRTIHNISFLKTVDFTGANF
ncbi:MAG: pentapeptide repeat-containing protein, partial [Limisphaerales bacterium]